MQKGNAARKGGALELSCVFQNGFVAAVGDLEDKAVFKLCLS
jgi:hypothetical protein